MAKGLASVGERVAALVAKIEAEAYARGRADTRKELLDALGAAQGRPAPAKTRRARSLAKEAPKRPGGRGGRAPRGSVPRFVGRVLGESPGATAAEIAGHAASDVERSIRLASIRVELIKGRKQGRYVSDNGRWSLVATGTTAAPSGEALSSDPSPGVVPSGEAAAGGVAEDSGGTGSETAEEGDKGTLRLNL